MQVAEQPGPKTATRGRPVRLDIVSDTICPWCYIGKRHLEAALPILAADGLSFDVRWRPFQLNPDMPEGGVERRVYREAKFGSLEASRRLDTRVAQAAAAAGLTFRHDLMMRTPNTIASHVLVEAACENGAAAQDRLVDALFAAYFLNGEDVGDHDVLARLWTDVGLDRDTAHARLADGAAAERIRTEDGNARRLGIDGVPAVLVEGRHLFSGAQPPEIMVCALREAVAAIA